MALIADINAKNLAIASAQFIAEEGLEVTPEITSALTPAVFAGCAKWYGEHGKEFNPKEELIEPEAITYAFTRVRYIAFLAKMSVLTGVDMSGMISD